MAVAETLLQKMAFTGGPRFAVECKTGEKALSPSLRYFAERTDIPKFYQVHLGKSHFQHSNIAMLPYARFCRELELP
jgi:uncharacterized protein